MEDWSDVQLDDVIAIKHGFAFKGEHFVDYPTDDVLVTPGNFAIGGGFRLEKAKFYDGPIPPDYVLSPGDIIATMTDLSKQADTLGYSAVIPESKYRFLHNQRIGKVTLRDHSVDLAFIAWLMRTDGYRHQIVGSATGSTVKHTSPGRILSYRFKLPPSAEQRRISDVLSALDDKIEVSRRMNETLEANARALFRDWFVDFGPTRAKAEGRPAYLAPDLWSLFPNRLGDDGLPSGWSDTPLDQIADFLNGLALQKFPAAPGASSLPVIKIAELRSGVSASSNRASIDVPSKYVIADGDFLFSWSGSLLAKFWTEGAGALNQHLFKVSSETHPAWFFSQWVWHHLAEFQAIAASKATTMGHIQRGHLSAAMTVTPPPSTLVRMSAVMQPLLDRVLANLLESRTLAATRDAVLPKLMSGELRVRDAEALAA